MELSVVISSKSDDPFLYVSLSSVTRALESFHADVLVSDCSPEGIDASRLSRRFPQVKLVRSEGKDFPTRFAEMVARCTTPYLLWIHAGIVMPENFIAVALAALQEHPEFGACSGTLLVPGKRQSVGTTPLERFQSNCSDTSVPALHEACWMFRREMALKVGAFGATMPEDVRDADYLDRMLSLGYQHICLPLLVLHYQVSVDVCCTREEITSYYLGLKRYLSKTFAALHAWERFTWKVRLQASKFGELMKLSFGQLSHRKSVKDVSPCMLIFTNESHLATLRNLCSFNHLEEAHRFVLSSEKSVSTLSMWKKDQGIPYAPVVFDNSLFSYRKMLTLSDECLDIDYNIGIYDAESRALICSTRIYYYKQ